MADISKFDQQASFIFDNAASVELCLWKNRLKKWPK